MPGGSQLSPEAGSITPSPQAAQSLSVSAVQPLGQHWSRPAVEQVLADYIGLYAGPTINRWRTLFHPAVVVAFPDEDGTIRTRTLDEFVTRQENYFASGRRISERLENVRIDMGRRIARVSADFVFMDERAERPGKLGLHLAEGKDGWRIVAVLFAYDAAQL